MRVLALVALCCAVLGAGCKSKEPSANPVSRGSGNNNFDSASIVRVSTGDSKSPAIDTGGSADAGSDAGVLLSWSHCANVEATNVPGEGAPNNSIQGPIDFEVSRVSLGYSPDCTTPTVILEMSNGSCPDHFDHWLRFEFDASAIALHAVTLGEIDLATAHGLGQIQVRYHRPTDLMPSGMFGACGAETGSITLTSEPDLSRGTVYSGNFQMTLTACPGTDGAPQDVQGTFNAPLAESLSDLCPGLAFTP